MEKWQLEMQVTRAVLCKPALCGPQRCRTVIFVGKRIEEPGSQEKEKEAKKRQGSRHPEYLQVNLKRHVKL